MTRWAVSFPALEARGWVTPDFYALDFETKQNFLSVVYLWYMKQDRRFNIVVLKDSRTGKQVGTYSAHNPGLEMD